MSSNKKQKKEHKPAAEQKTEVKQEQEQEHKAKRTSDLEETDDSSLCSEYDEETYKAKDELHFNEYMQYFTVYFSGQGELKEIDIDGKAVQVYQWCGVNSRGKRVIVQLWRHNAPVFAKFVE